MTIRPHTAALLLAVADCMIDAMARLQRVEGRIWALRRGAAVFWVNRLFAHAASQPKRMAAFNGVIGDILTRQRAGLEGIGGSDKESMFISTGIPSTHLSLTSSNIVIPISHHACLCSIIFFICLNTLMIARYAYFRFAKMNHSRTRPPASNPISCSLICI